MTGDQLNAFMRDVACVRDTARRLRATLDAARIWLTTDELDACALFSADIEALALRLTVQAAHLVPDVPALPNRVDEQERPAVRIIH